MKNPKILAFSGSIRSGSCNTRLLGAAVRELGTLDCEVTRISLEDYDLPLYNGDLEEKSGIPENAVRLAKLMHSHDGFFIASPEYNGSLSPLMKNTLDWVSRTSSDQIVPYRGKVAAISAASPGAMGGMSMMYHLRDILVRLGVTVVSEQVALGNANKGFDEMDNLLNERAAGLLTATCKSLATKASLLGD